MPLKRYSLRWQLLSLVLFIALLVSYWWYTQNEAFPHGGSVIGLIYGFIALALMLILVFFGMRKRWHRSRWGKLESWLQGHMYLGILSFFVILAHTGFRFQDKVAVSLFVVIVVVILSGMFGAVLYRLVPRMLTEVGSNLTIDEMSDQINQLARSMSRIASEKSAPFQRIYRDLMKQAVPGWAAGWRLLLSDARGSALRKSQGEWTKQIGSVGSDEQADLRQLLVLSRQHRELHIRLVAQQRYKNLLDFWLFLHLPLSLVMLVLIVAHIWGAFYYSNVSVLIPWPWEQR